MKFCAVAIDYDGTTGGDAGLDPDARSVLAELRSRGIVVLLVTGRIVSDLTRVAGDLHFADAVIAENGAVVFFPASGYTARVGHRPPLLFLAALRDAGVDYECGDVVVEALASDAERILRVIRTLELPLVLVFNRGRLMVLPQTISKATGVTLALNMLRLSPHNTMAIGDAENDHELLRASEFGVAVGWGSEALKAAADEILEGDGPSAVGPFLRTRAASLELPAPSLTRRHLLLGHTDDGQPLALAVRGRNVLVAGDPKSGKSWVAGLLAEQLIFEGYCVCIIDPEGDYVSLEALPDVEVLGGANPLPRPMDLLRALRHADASVIIDLSHASQPDKIAYVRSVLPALATLRRRTGLPHRIVVDEAHYFLRDPDVAHLLDLELNGYTLVTYRASALHADVLGATQALVITRESDPEEVRALFALCGSCASSADEAEWIRLAGALAIGEAAVLPITDEAKGAVRRIRLAPRMTPHVRHQAKYVDIPVPDARAFVFWRHGAPDGSRACTLRAFVDTLEGAGPTAFDGHLKRHDFSRWITDVFGDLLLGKTLRHIEDEVRQGVQPEALQAIAGAVRRRYEFAEAPRRAVPQTDKALGV